MEAVFLKLVNMSITASYLVAAVLVLRLLLKKAPKWIHCALWALVALRLLLPFSPESAFSVIPNPEPLPEEFLYAAAPQIDTGFSSVDNALNPVIAESLKPAELTSANPTQIQSFVFSQIWILGMVLMVLYAVVSYAIVRRKVRISIALDKTVRLCDHIDTPFILGIIRPKIYLPSELDPMTAGHVLAHEQAHLKRRDHWWKPLGFALLSVYWFNPVIWLAYVLLCRDIEQACDEKVVKELDSDGRKAYSMALLQCSVPRRMIAACPLAFGEVGVKSRIKSVLNYRKPAFWVILMAIIACIAAAVCFLTDPKDSGPGAYEVTSQLWIYDAKTVDVTVWDEDGAHNVNLNRLEIEKLSEIIHYLQKDEFIKEKPKAHKLCAVLNCEDYTVDLHWDGKYAYFTFDAETEKGITGNRRSVKNEALNTFLAEIMQMEFRLAAGTYAPIEASSNAGWDRYSLPLAQSYRYEVTEDAFSIHDMNTGDVTTFSVDWGWEDYMKANERIPVYQVRSITQTFDILEPELNDLTLKYQYISEDYHLLSQNGALCLLVAGRLPGSDFINWKAYRLVADHPQLLPPRSFSEFLDRIDEVNGGDAFNRSGDCRPGRFSMTEEEVATLCGILKQMPDAAVTPTNEQDVDFETVYIEISASTRTENSIGCFIDIYYDYERILLQWYDPYTETFEFYQIDYAPLRDFLKSMMQPERINDYGIMIDTNDIHYVSYSHEDIHITLLKVIGWDYEIVPYVDEKTDFGIRCKPEWMEDWLFFGYMQGRLVPESTFLHEVDVEPYFGDEWHYLFENPIAGRVEWREWPEPWKMIYHYADGGTYYIYNEGAFDERLSEHDRGGYLEIQRSFGFIFAEKNNLIDNSRKYVDVTKYEKPEVSYNAEDHCFDILWHRKDSDGYIIVHNYPSWIGDTVTEVAGTESE